MRRLFALVLLACLVCTAALAEDSMAGHARQLGARLDTLLDDTAYISMLTGSPAVAQVAQGWAAQNHTAPGVVLQLDCSALLNTLVPGTAGFSRAAMGELQRRLPATIASQLNAACGAETLAAASACTASSVFAASAQGSGLYVMLYAGAYPVFVSWYAENGAVSMQATIVADDALANCRDAASFDAWMQEKGLALPWSVAQ